MRWRCVPCGLPRSSFFGLSARFHRLYGVGRYPNRIILSTRIHLYELVLSKKVQFRGLENRGQNDPIWVLQVGNDVFGDVWVRRKRGGRIGGESNRQKLSVSTFLDEWKSPSTRRTCQGFMGGLGNVSPSSGGRPGSRWIWRWRCSAGSRSRRRCRRRTRSPARRPARCREACRTHR